MKEHILSNYTSEKLHQHLVGSELVTSKELGNKADKWVKTRVSRKTKTGSDQKEGVTTPSQGKEVGHTRENKKESPKGPEKSSQEGGP